jgi:hypothetical protein
MYRSTAELTAAAAVRANKMARRVVRANRQTKSRMTIQEVSEFTTQVLLAEAIRSNFGIPTLGGALPKALSCEGFRTQLGPRATSTESQSRRSEDTVAGVGL